MTDEQIIAAAKKIDTPHGKIGLIHVREDGQEVPTFMAKQFAAELLAELEAENARLLMANRDCVDHFNQLKEDYDALLDAAVLAGYASAKAAVAATACAKPMGNVYARQTSSALPSAYYWQTGRKDAE